MLYAKENIRNFVYIFFCFFFLMFFLRKTAILTVNSITTHGRSNDNTRSSCGGQSTFRPNYRAMVLIFEVYK